jgi:hypothetical protein
MQIFFQTGFIEGNINIEDVEIEPFLDEVEDLPDYRELLDESRKKNEQVKSESLSKKLYPSVTFLGTGSSVPSKYRCVSAILVSYFLRGLTVNRDSRSELVSKPLD